MKPSKRTGLISVHTVVWFKKKKKKNKWGKSQEYSVPTYIMVQAIWRNWKRCLKEEKRPNQTKDIENKDFPYFF